MKQGFLQNCKNKLAMMTKNFTIGNMSGIFQCYRLTFDDRKLHCTYFW